MAQPDPADLAEACGINPGLACEKILDWTGSVGLAKTADWLLDTPLTILLILVVAFVANRLIRRAIRKFVAGIADEGGERVQAWRLRTPAVLRRTGATPTLRSAARARTLGQVLRSISTCVIYSLAALLVLGELGVHLGPLIAGAGIAGVAIGFGAQSLVKDFLSGIFMLIEDQYGVGDIVDVGVAEGAVEAVSLRTTRLRDVNGTVWHVPNGEIRRVGNKSQEWARALVDVPVANHTDIGRAEDVIQRVADDLCRQEEWKGVILEPPEVWGVETLGPEGLTIRLVVKTRPAQQFKLMRELRGRVKEALDAADEEKPATPPTSAGAPTAPSTPP